MFQLETYNLNLQKVAVNKLDKTMLTQFFDSGIDYLIDGRPCYSLTLLAVPIMKGRGQLLD